MVLVKTEKSDGKRICEDVVITINILGLLLLQISIGRLMNPGTLQEINP